jgi:hypothetical protein
MDKSLITLIAAVAFISTSMVGTSSVFARESDVQNDPMHTLVQKLAQKFKVDESEIQTVFDQVHEQKRSEMQKKFEDRLSQLVTEGKITEAQKQLLLSKQKELQQMRTTMLDMTPEERKVQKQQLQTELKEWAEQNDIDLHYLMPFGWHKGGGFGKHMRVFEAAPSPTISQ